MSAVTGAARDPMSVVGANGRDMKYGQDHHRKGMGTWIIGFFIVWIVVGIIMALWNPPALQTVDPATGQPSGQPNLAAVAFASFVATLVLFIVLWVARYCCW